jgi:DNA mismatch repair protein MutS
LEIDKVTYYDLSILNNEEEYSLLSRINFCKTAGGADHLQYLLTHPLRSEKEIKQTQEAIRQLQMMLQQWPSEITNGTLLVLEKFYGYPFDKIPNSYSPVPAFLYMVFDTPDFSLVRYTVGHFMDFLKGMNHLVQLLKSNSSSAIINNIVKETEKLMKPSVIQHLIAEKNCCAMVITCAMNIKMKRSD